MFAVIYLVFAFNSLFVLLKGDCDMNKFRESIVPSIVPKIPPQELKIFYPETAVNCGQDINITITKNAPLLNYSANNLDFHALVMIDPDAPDPHRPVYAQFLHWFVVNIPGNHIDKGKVLKDYMQPSPPPYSASHRYVFFVFRQLSYIFNPTYMLAKGRSWFSVENMTNELSATDLVAGNFFYTCSRA